MTAKDPGFTGVDHDTVADPEPATTDTEPGAEGVTGVGGVGGVGDVGVTALDAADAPDVASPLVAVEVNVYDVPGVRPVTTHDVAGTITVQVPPAGLDVTAYVEGVPPELGGVIETVADPAPPIAVGAPGTPGALRVIDVEATEDPDVPPTFVAVDVKV